MTGAVFSNTLRTGWRQLLWWGVGLLVLGLYTLLIIPNSEMLAQYSSFVESLPPVFMQMMGISSAASFATPQGFVALIYTFILLILMAWAVLSGLGVTANEEDEGILDVLLSLPIARWRVIVEKFLVVILFGLVIVALSYLGFFLGFQTAQMDMDMGSLFQTAMGMAPALLFAAALTVFFSALLSNKGTAVGLTVAVIVGSYFLNFLGESASGTIFGTLRGLSFFYYYRPETIMSSGLDWGGVAVLLVGTVVLLAGSLWAFQRRDVGV